MATEMTRRRQGDGDATSSVRDRDDGSPRPCRLLAPAPGPGLSPELGKTRGERDRGEAERREGERREESPEKRGEASDCRGEEQMIRARRGAASVGAYIALPPTGGSPPQWADPTVDRGRGGGCGRAPSDRLRA